MSNGAAGWLCKSCKGPDRQPWRNWADKDRCHKCKLLKKACWLKDVPKSGSPTRSLRQSRGGAGGSGNGKGSGLSAAQAAAAEKAAARRIEELTRETKAKDAKLQAMEAKLREASGGMEVDVAEVVDDTKALRGEIAHLEHCTGPHAEAALAEKRALLQSKQAAAREAKPLDTRAKDIERFVDSKKRAVAKQEVLVADLQAKREQIEADLAAAQEKDRQLREDLAKAEAEKVDILHRMAAETAAGNGVASQPLVLKQGLVSLERQLQLGQCVVPGMSAEQIQAVLAVVGALLQGSAPASLPAAAGDASAALATLPAPASLPSQLAAAVPESTPLVASGGPAPANVQPQPPQEGQERAGGPAGGEHSAAEAMDVKELLALGASLGDIEGWKTVYRLREGRGQRSGPYADA